MGDDSSKQEALAGGVADSSLIGRHTSSFLCFLLVKLVFGVVVIVVVSIVVCCKTLRTGTNCAAPLLAGRFDSM